jgi:uncharacterized glyoxalase superfamily protein PhnB
MNWKPQNYNSVSPYLVVNGAQKVVDFAKAVFDAKELRRYDMPDGTLRPSELSRLISNAPIGRRDSGRSKSELTNLAAGTR